MLKPNSNFNGISVSFVTNYDCNLACKYDLAKGTKVLMSDFTYKNIEDVKIGDKIIAFDEFPVKNEESGIDYGREYKIAEVLDSQMTRELTEAYKYTFKDGDKEITVVASGEHPILNINTTISDKDYITTEDPEKIKHLNKYRQKAREKYKGTIPVKLEIIREKAKEMHYMI